MQTKSTKLKWYHWVIGLPLIIALFWWIDQPDTKSRCDIPVSGDGVKVQNVIGCKFESKSTNYSPTRVSTLSFDKDNTTCTYTERDINSDNLSYSETVKLTSVEQKRSGYDGKKQLVFNCAFEKFPRMYFVYNENSSTIVEVDGDPNGSFWTRSNK